MTYQLPEKIHFSKSLLVRQMIVTAFVVSFFLFVISSAAQIYKDYQQGQSEIIAQIENLEHAVDTQLSNALWNLDKDALEQILNVLIDNPNVATVKIISDDLHLTENRNGTAANWITNEYPLIFKDQKEENHSLGKLTITLSKDKFYNQLKEKMLLSIVDVFIRLVVIGLCVFWIINKKILHPIRNIQFMTKNFNNAHLNPILGDEIKLNQKEFKSEIDHLHEDIHLLQENFINAFSQLKKTEEERSTIKLELEKERQKILLGQRLEAIGHITSQVAHDFANLVTMINGKTKMLEAKLNNEDDLKHTASIKNATSKANNLIKKILSMTRVHRMELAEFNPYLSIANMKDLLEMSIGPTIKLQIEADGTDGIIYVEPSAFENVIINLCVNARDAMPNGGEVRISINQLQKNNCSYISVAVSDSGTGIPDEIKSKIFDPFFTTKSAEKGTGLGLSQVQDFVKNAGGFLELNSSDTGSCFTLNLPNKKEQKRVA